MFLQSFFLLSNTGEIFIEKHWRILTPRSICDHFRDEINRYLIKTEVPPIIVTSQYYLINIYRENLFMLAIVTRETSPLLIIEYLHRIFDIFEDYFGSPLDEEIIKDNFSLIYQLLEEMNDFGFALTMEPNSLQVMIQKPSVLSKLTQATIGGTSVSDILPESTISPMPWRNPDVHYTQNEIYLDIIEEVDAILDRSGLVISSEVMGSIVGNSKLSGIPDLTLTFNDPTIVEDSSLHPCVRYNRFERDKIVSFVPPDGCFELMRYRLHKIGTIAAPIYVQPIIILNNNNQNNNSSNSNNADLSAMISITVGMKAQHQLIFGSNSNQGNVVVEDVVVEIPLTKYIRSTNLKVTTGTLFIDEATKHVKWTIGKVSRDNSTATSPIQLTGSVQLHPIQPHGLTPTSTVTESSIVDDHTLHLLQQESVRHSLRDDPPVGNGSNNLTSNSQYTEQYVASCCQVHWKVPLASISGLSVASLQLVGEKYKPFKGVRSVTKSGKYLVRFL